MKNQHDTFWSLEKQFKKFSLTPWEPKVKEIHKNRIVEGSQPQDVGQLVRRSSEGTNIREEKVLKKDKRVHVPDTKCFPESTHVFLKMDFGDEARDARGSGQMIGPYHVLTCAHNIYDFKNSKWADEISVYPGANGKGNNPFGEIAAVKAIIPRDYTLGKKVGEEADIALILLEKKIGYETGWASFAYLQDDEFNGLEIWVSGYPGDKEEGTLHEMDGKIVKKKRSILYYNISTMPGQSGSPIWRKGGFPVVLGVHCRAGEDGKEWNEGTRISKKYFDWITSCMEMNHAAAICKERDQGCKVEPLDFERINSLIHLYENGIKYTGHYKEGKKKGYDINDIKAPIKQGFGLLIQANGERYKGHFSDDQRHGQGVCTYSDGSEYAGQWRYGKREGQGTLTWPDGSYYKGPFHQNQRNGDGIFEGSDGSVYIGKWEKDKRHGYGNLTNADESFYKGMFDQNEKHGQGTYKYPNGSVYEGQWRYGRKEGQGKLTLTDGYIESYEGEFYNDFKHGKGTERLRDGSIYIGQWRNNKTEGLEQDKILRLDEIYGQDNSPKKVPKRQGKNDKEEKIELKPSKNDQVSQEQNERPKDESKRRSIKKSQSFEVDSETISELCYLVSQFAGGQRIFDPSKLMFGGEKFLI